MKLLIIALCLASCGISRNATPNDYRITVRIVSIKQVNGYYTIVARSRADHFYKMVSETLPDTIVVGKVLQLPIFKRIK